MYFHNPDKLIDLVEFGRLKKNRPYKNTQTGLLISMVSSVCCRGQTYREFSTLVQCIEHILRGLYWQSSFFFIPMRKEYYCDTTFILSGRGEILPESIMATALFYDSNLKKRYRDGLSDILFSEFITGLDWTIFLSRRGYMPESFESIPLLDAEQINKFIPKTEIIYANL